MREIFNYVILIRLIKILVNLSGIPVTFARILVNFGESNKSTIIAILIKFTIFPTPIYIEFWLVQQYEMDSKSKCAELSRKKLK